MRSWSQVEAELRASSPGTRIIVGKSEIETPAQAGATRSIGLPSGQLSDWRFPPSAGCRSVHVQEFPTTYLAHLDEVDPGCAPVQHLLVDAPIVAALGVGGAVLGAMVGRVRGTFVGLAGGLVLGVLVHWAVTTPPPAPTR
jgi:hypothetical protein